MHVKTEVNDVRQPDVAASTGVREIRQVLLHGRVDAVAASDVEPEAVEWLWQDRIPNGSVTLLAGDPGLGKSMLTCLLAAELSQGRIGGAQATALLLSAEDNRASTVRPRLEAAGADLSHVRFPRRHESGVEIGWTFPDDVAALRALVEEHQARLVVIDPLMAHLSETVNSWHDQSVRRALAPLHRMAEETGAALLVVLHLNKGQDTDPLRRFGGSIGVPAAARSALLLGRDPDDPAGEQGCRRVLAQVKNNLGAPAASLLYEIQETELAGKEAVGSSRLVLLGDSGFSGAELLAAQPQADGGSALNEAEQLLRTELANGPRLTREILQVADDAAVSRQTLKRAKARLGVTSSKVDFSRGWAWTLPTSREEQA